MDSEDWGADANAPVFSLYSPTSPQEAASQYGFIDTVTYNHWKKADRRLYRQLKAKHLFEKIEQGKIETINDLTAALDSLNLIKTTAEEHLPGLDDAIKKLEILKIDKTTQ